MGYRMRTLLVSFGGEYRLRCQLYMGVTVSILLASTLVLLTKGGGQADSGLTAANNALWLSYLGMVVCVAGLIILAGAKANGTVSTQLEVLNNSQLLLEELNRDITLRRATLGVCSSKLVVTHLNSLGV